MDTEAHNTVCGVESLLNTVPMMTVDVDVQDAWIRTEEREDAEDDVVDVAEAGSLCFLCVVEAACPVDGDVCSTGGYAFCCGWEERWV